jgi:organic radical activating enzyme
MSTFCTAPFIHQYVGNSGTSRLCCAQQGDLRYKWNDEAMQEVRRKKLNNEKVKGCEECYHNDAIGSLSDRKLMNEFTDFKPDIVKGNETGLPLTFDLRLNNLCNLQCRMCGPYSSSQIDKQLKRHPELLQFDSPAVKHETVDLNFSKAIEVKLLGGEPMLQSEAYDILERLDPNVKIFITSNLTNLNKRFMKLIKKFDKVKIHWSIDGTEKTYEYIRHPAKWKTIQKNLKEFRDQLPHVDDRIHVCVSAYNVFDFWKISNYIGGGCDYICANTPEEMDISILPDKWRDHALDEFYQNFKGYDDLYTSKLSAIIHRLENGKHDEKKMNILKVRTELYDNAYGKSIYDYIPIFKKVFA